MTPRGVRVVNRYVRGNSHGERGRIEYESHPRDAELVVKSLNLESAKGVTTPSVKKSLETTDERIADMFLSQCRDESSVSVVLC